MPLDFYSPRPENKGAALFVSFNSKEGALFLNVLKQASWNAQTKKGTFKGGTRLNVKLNQDEIGNLIHAIQNKCHAEPMYHSFDGKVTTISFMYYEREMPRPNGDPIKKKGFGLTIKSNNVEYKIGFTLGGAIRLCQYLEFALTHMFNAIYAEDKKRAEKYARNEQQANEAINTSEPAEVDPSVIDPSVADGAMDF